mmetsp:Transcript_35198/g.80308  ORF Transcript_35198/g.80308 Transcript_35198/m.80308 type:complete len:742 (+) Transcript_35198:97-2322(+)
MEAHEAGVGLVLVGDREKSIAALSPGGPASRAGLAVGDVVLAIDCVDVSSISLTEAGRLCKGDAGKKAEFRIRRAGTGNVETVFATRCPIVVDSRESNAERLPEPGSFGMAIEARKEDGEKQIASVHPDGPIAAADLVPGDVIVSVDGVPLTQLELRDACAMLRGPKDSDAVLVVRRLSGEVELVRVRRGPRLPMPSTPSCNVLVFPRRVSCVLLTPTAAHLVESGPLALNGRVLSVGRWQCALNGENALRVGPLTFMFNLRGHAVGIVFPPSYPNQAQLIQEFERRIVACTQYRSTLPGSSFNTPCHQDEISTCVDRLHEMSSASRSAYHNFLVHLDPVFAAQVNEEWAKQKQDRLSSSMAQAQTTDGLEDLGRALGQAFSRVLGVTTATAELTAKQCAQLLGGGESQTSASQKHEERKKPSEMELRMMLSPSFTLRDAAHVLLRGNTTTPTAPQAEQAAEVSVEPTSSSPAGLPRLRSELLRASPIKTGPVRLQKARRDAWLPAHCTLSAYALIFYPAPASARPQSVHAPPAQRAPTPVSAGASSLSSSAESPSDFTSASSASPPRNRHSAPVEAATSEKWVLVARFTASKRSSHNWSNRRSPLGGAATSAGPSAATKGPELVLPLANVQHVQADGSRFFVFMWGRRAPYTMEVSSHEEATRWVSMLRSAAAAERRRTASPPAGPAPDRAGRSLPETDEEVEVELMDLDGTDVTTDDTDFDLDCDGDDSEACVQEPVRA